MLLFLYLFHTLSFPLFTSHPLFSPFLSPSRFLLLSIFLMYLPRFLVIVLSLLFVHIPPIFLLFFPYISFMSFSLYIFLYIPPFTMIFVYLTSFVKLTRVTLFGFVIFNIWHSFAHTHTYIRIDISNECSK